MKTPDKTQRTTKRGPKPKPPDVRLSLQIDTRFPAYLGAWVKAMGGGVFLRRLAEEAWTKRLEELKYPSP